jgi:hypothetical protein
MNSDAMPRPVDEDDVVTVGQCPRCRVGCAGRAEDRGKLEELLRVHQQHCPGGDRAGDVWLPFGDRHIRS